MPYQMRRLEAAVQDCDLFVSIGTSGAVYPAAGFVHLAKTFGAKTLELNLDPSQGSAAFHDARHGPATQLVPDWVASLL
jgi:NAD-dependent deacetylase